MKKGKKSIKAWAVTFRTKQLFHPRMFDRAYSVFWRKKDATDWMKVNVHPAHKAVVSKCEITL